ncbi:MAG: mechanosensitive ion channel [Deltaproteobacteria bacterium]|nr:mechanosensitive ion channel [Deltaproteobacteria bacterium]
MNGTIDLNKLDLTSFKKEILIDLLHDLVSWVSEYGFRLIVAVLIFYLGMKVSRKISDLIQAALKRGRIEQTLSTFLGNIAYYAIMAAVVIAAISQLGISVTSFMAILGAAGLAVGLALKDSLANFSSGVMIIIFRFFKVGDFVDLAGTSGTVDSINIFNTVLITPDNQKIFIPNSRVLSQNITNITANPTRRLDLVIGISYDDDVAKAKKIVADILAKENRILPDPKPTIVLGELADSSVNLFVRPWVKTSELWAVRWDLLEAIKTEFDRQGITIPYPQQDVHFKPTPPQA